MKGTIPDLDWVAWQGRKVVIAYDTDIVTNDLVRIARSDLAAHLRRELGQQAAAGDATHPACGGGCRPA